MSSNSKSTIARAMTAIVVSILFTLAAGCGQSGPESSLPPQQAAAYKALAEKNVKITIHDGEVNFVDFYGVRGVPELSAHLKAFPNLQKINFSSTDITNEGLAHLAGITSLKEVALTNTGINDQGLAHLAGLTKLEVLTLNRDFVTDAGLAHLAKMTELTQLHLNQTQVSDAGLKHLADCQKLKWFLVYGTRVTADGAAEFRKSHPGTEVVNTEGDSAADAKPDGASAEPPSK